MADANVRMPDEALTRGRPSGHRRNIMALAVSGGSTVTPVDVATETAGTQVPVGKNPVALAITPDGRTLYVACGSAGTSVHGQSVFSDVVLPLDVATRAIGPQIEVGQGADILSLAMTGDGRTLYAAFGKTATPIDVATGKAGKPVSVGDDSEALVVTPDGRTLYAADADDDTVTPGTLRK
jgi:DNA-binding beta-propeller fold protein YncE